MSTTYLFVGEQPSQKAADMKVTWRDGRLAAKPLFEAIEACGLSPLQQEFTNLFKNDRVNRIVLGKIKRCKLPIVAMGNKVQAMLIEHGVKFIPIVHPAARGKIRRRDRYIKHVKNALSKKNCTIKMMRAA